MMTTAPGSGTVSWMSPFLRPGQPPPPGRLVSPLTTRPRVRRDSPPRPQLSCCSPPCHISLQFRDRDLMAIIMITKAKHFTTLADLHHFCLIQIHPQTPTSSHLVVAVTLGEVGEASGGTGEDLVTGDAVEQRTDSLRGSLELLAIGFPAPLDASVIMTIVIEGP